jgi:hypothetical protein
MAAENPTMEVDEASASVGKQVSFVILIKGDLGCLNLPLRDNIIDTLVLKE